MDWTMIGALATIILGVLALLFVKEKITQKQKAGKNSISIQSGRDTKINNKND